MPRKKVLPPDAASRRRKVPACAGEAGQPDRAAAFRLPCHLQTARIRAGRGHVPAGKGAQHAGERLIPWLFAVLRRSRVTPGHRCGDGCVSAQHQSFPAAMAVYWAGSASSRAMARKPFPEPGHRAGASARHRLAPRGRAARPGHGPPLTTGPVCLCDAAGGLASTGVAAATGRGRQLPAHDRLAP